ncbi:MAG: ABC transporter ATP-binding protein [Parvularculaceae bacterium]
MLAEMSLIVKDLRHSYGDDSILNGVDLDTGAGEIVCLFGPSGCGKTTLLRLAAGLERVQQGQVLLDGQVIASDCRHVPPERREIGFVFQEFVLFPHLTVAENIAFGISHLAPPDRDDRVTAELAAVDLSGFAGRYPYQLSGGQQQRAALARAFARTPKVMLLDEPFASIDTALRRRLRTEMRQILKARGTPAILVTHDPSEAIELGDRIAVMNDGRIVEAAPPEALYMSPTTIEGASIFPGIQIVDAIVESGIYHTAFGPAVSASKIDKDHVRLVVHQGALSARRVDAGAAHVTDCNFVGPGWQVMVESLEKPGISVRAAAASRLPTGAQVLIDFDPAQVRVFGAV